MKFFGRQNEIKEFQYRIPGVVDGGHVNMPLYQVYIPAKHLFTSAIVRTSCCFSFSHSFILLA